MKECNCSLPADFSFECSEKLFYSPLKLYFKPEDAILISGSRVIVRNPEGWLYTNKELTNQYCQFKDCEWTQK